MSKQAKIAAKKILEEIGYDLPVNVYAVVQKYEVEVRNLLLEDEVSGMLVIKDDHAIIGVNQSHHSNRQRFSIAHELGHYLLHRHSANVFVDPVFFRDGKSSEGVDETEVAANIFAAELLMPEAVVTQQFQEDPFDPFDDLALRRMAARFEVSPQALNIRLSRLGLISH